VGFSAGSGYVLTLCEVAATFSRRAFEEVVAAFARRSLEDPSCVAFHDFVLRDEGRSAGALLCS
jgi:hypothetical protein